MFFKFVSNVLVFCVRIVFINTYILINKTAELNRDNCVYWEPSETHARFCQRNRRTWYVFQSLDYPFWQYQLRSRSARVVPELETVLNAGDTAQGGIHVVMIWNWGTYSMSNSMNWLVVAAKRCSHTGLATMRSEFILWGIVKWWKFCTETARYGSDFSKTINPR